MKIEYGHPLPAPRISWTACFEAMKVGGSIFVPKRLARQARVNATGYKKRHPEFNYRSEKAVDDYEDAATGRIEKNVPGLRLHRIEPEPPTT